MLNALVALGLVRGERAAVSDAWYGDRRPCPGASASEPISTNGGTEPVWSRDGKSLFYREGTTLMSVTFSSTTTMDHGRPVALFADRYEPEPYGGREANYDVSPDGARFLMVRRNNLAHPATAVTWSRPSSRV